MVVVGGGPVALSQSDRLGRGPCARMRPIDHVADHVTAGPRAHAQYLATCEVILRTHFFEPKLSVERSSETVAFFRYSRFVCWHTSRCSTVWSTVKRNTQYTAIDFR